ncbi:MAG: beta-ketoacyl-[acyl-carrier-protein] synthase family protein [Edaphocola sp.]
MSKAYIISSGIVTAIGLDKKENLASLKDKKAGISYPEYLNTIHHLPVGEIKKSNAELAAMAGAPETLPRTALLSIIAAKQAWQPVAQKTKGLRIAFLSANTVGGMDISDRFYKEFLKDPQSGDLNDVRYHECGTITNLTLHALGLDCWRTTISTACSSSANSIMMGAKLLGQGKYDVVVAGGADALSRFTLNGFNSLMILDKEPCRPFDEHRRGLNLGEGAGYIVMVNEASYGKLGMEAKAAVTGYANANDAHHQTASSPDGKGNQLAMQRALAQADITPKEIDYINLHGTGTGNNDASEGAAITTLFENKVPAASSTKAFTGHTLGAAGAVEAIYALLSIEEQISLPHLRLATPMAQFCWQPTYEVQHIAVNHVLSNSFGFGGNCSALVFSKI